MADKSLVRRLHDATCPGAVAGFKPVQRICPVCRSTASDGESAAE